MRRISKFNSHTRISFDELCKEFRLVSPVDGREVPWTRDKYFDEFIKYSTQYPDGDFLAESLTGLQTAVQKICERVVLLDKVQYAREESPTADCRIEKITNDELSPRCYALILTKGQGV